MQTPQFPIEVTALRKSFDHKLVLDVQALKLEEGRIVGLLGVNGAGKSTLLRHIPGMYLPDGGSCKVFNTPSRMLKAEQLAQIGYVDQESPLIDWMTVNQLIVYMSTFYPTWNSTLELELIKLFEIDRAPRVGKLSPGQRQKLAILLAVAFEPNLLILDEPASALDPIARKAFLELLMKLIQKEGRTIIISSHILGDIEKVVDYVVILHRGRVVVSRDLDELREEYRKIRVSDVQQLLSLPELRTHTHLMRTEGSEGLLCLPREKVEQLERSSARALILGAPQPMTLEEIFEVVVGGAEGSSESSPLGLKAVFRRREV